MDLKAQDVRILLLLKSTFEEAIPVKEAQVDDSMKNGLNEDAKGYQIALEVFKHNLASIDSEIKRRVNDHIPKFSVEEIYFLLGQYDKYASYEMYPGTETFKTYGPILYGTPIYTKDERDFLENEIQKKPIPKSKGKIKISAVLVDDIIKEKLATDGFFVEDVCEILSSNWEPKEKKYKIAGNKKIPHELKIGVQELDFKSEINVMIHVNDMLIRAGHFLNNEYQLHCALLCLFYKDRLSEELKLKYLTDPETGGWNDNSTFLLLRLFNSFGVLPSEYRGRYYQLIKRRMLERKAKFFTSMGINEKVWKKIEKEDKEKCNKIIYELIHYEPHTLSYCDTKKPVYIDVDRFIHIYARHCKDFFLHGKSTKQIDGTHFQYEYKDIKKIIDHLIGQHKEKIDYCMENGYQFRLGKSNAFYYNGNYYLIRINKEGKIMQFFPME